MARGGMAVQHQLTSITGAPAGVEIQHRGQATIGLPFESVQMLFVKSTNRVSGVMTFIIEQPEEKAPVERLSEAFSPSQKLCASRGLTPQPADRSEEHTSELQSRGHLVCRLLLEKKKEQSQ